MEMRKHLIWNLLERTVILFGFIGGMYQIINLINFSPLDSDKLIAKIEFHEFDLPSNLNKSFYSDCISIGSKLDEILTENLESYQLSEILKDSLENKIRLINPDLSLSEIIEKSLPAELEKTLIIDSVEKYIENIYVDKYLKFIYETRYIIKTSLSNEGNKIIRNLQFYIPTEGYYESILNDASVKFAYFKNAIELGELKPGDVFSIIIWSKENVSDYDVIYKKRIKYTYEKGMILPEIYEMQKTSGFIAWIKGNKLWAIYFMILLPVLFAFRIGLEIGRAFV